MRLQDGFIEDYKWALFVGECGTEQNVDQKRYIDFLRLGVAFLHQNFDEVPSGCQLGLIWFEYTVVFPVIGLASDLEPESEPKDLREQVNRMEKAMRVFDRSVDWQALSNCIDEFGKK